MNSTVPVRVEELIQHRTWVQALARSLVRDPALADDLTQETMLTALSRPPQDRRSIRGWLATVLRNRFRDRLRTESRRATREEAVAHRKPSESAAEIAARAESHRQVIQAVVNLDEPYRETVLLRYFEGLDTPEIARRQGVTASTVRTRISRALEQLRSRLDNEHGGDGRAWIVALLPLTQDGPGSGAPPVPLVVAGMAALVASAKVWMTVLGVLAVTIAVVLALVSSFAEPKSVPEVPVAEERAALPAEPLLPRALEDAATSEDEKSTAAAAGEVGPARTRRTGLAPLPLKDEIRLEIHRDGRIVLGDLTVKPEKGTPVWRQLQGDQIRHPLFLAADEGRDLAHPAQPSTRNFLYDFDGDTPWWLLRFAGELAADPAVRIYRVHWSVLPADRDSEAGLPVFFPRDHGLAATQIPLFGPPRPRLALLRSTPAGQTVVRFLGVNLGEGESGFAKLAEKVAALYDALPDADLLVDPWDDVPVSEVIRALDLIPGELSARNVMCTHEVEDMDLLFTASSKSRQLLEEQLQSWSLDFEGNILDVHGGPSADFWSFLAAHRIPEEIVALFEGLLSGSANRMPEIRELLTSQRLNFRQIRRLNELARLDRLVLLGLARGYLARNWDGDGLRAAALAGLVATASPELHYTPSWWHCQFLVLRGLIRHAERTTDRNYLAGAETLAANLAKLAAVAQTPRAEEFKAIETELERVSGRLR